VGGGKERKTWKGKQKEIKVKKNFSGIIINRKILFLFLFLFLFLIGIVF